jgi:sn-glycerol 3-phosphate transport system substrate-binding protein
MRKFLLTAVSATVLATAASAQTEITFWHAMGGALGDATNEIAEMFNASQSEYRIVPIYKGTYEETLTATIAAFRAGEQPNVVQVFDAGAATVIGAEGATIPAADLLAQFGSVPFSPDDYIEGVRNFYADADGKMIGMPFNSSTPIMYVNTEAFEKTGLTPPATWEEFEAMAPALAEAGYIPLAQSHLPWIFTENFMSRHNQPFATNQNGYEGADGTQILIKNEYLMNHFAKLKEWKDAGYFGFYGTGWNENQTPFQEGQVALWLGSSGSFSGLLQSATMPFSATFLPYWDAVPGAGTNTFIGGAALFAMSGKSDEENKATAAFFEFLTSPEVQVHWHKGTGYVPVTPAAYELAKSQGYYEEFPAAEVGVLQLQLPGSENTRGYRMGFYVQIRDVMNREYSRILSGETSVEDAFDAIETEANELLSRFARTSS